MHAQQINWEKYGLNVSVPRGTLSLSNTVEVSIIALVGGPFKFPINTKLVSAVYSISISSEPLFQPLSLEVQHCVNLTEEAQTNCLKFAIAPISKPSGLPYKFSVIDGGQFPVGSQYGYISLKEICLVCVVGKVKGTTLNDEGERPILSSNEDHKVALKEESSDSVSSTNWLLEQSQSIVHFNKFSFRHDICRTGLL